MIILFHGCSVVVDITRRSEVGLCQAPDIKVDILDLPLLFQVALVVGRFLPIAEDREAGPAAVCNVDTVDMLVVVHHRLCTGLPEDTVIIFGAEAKQT